jgi:hypothetical protein
MRSPLVTYEQMVNIWLKPFHFGNWLLSANTIIMGNDFSLEKELLVSQC